MRRAVLSSPVVAVGAVFALSGAALAVATQNTPLGEHRVGSHTGGAALTPMNQFVTPVGDVITRPGRPIATTVSPDGRTAADLTTGGKGVVTLTDLVAKKVLQTVVNPAGGSDDVSYGGIVYSPDGKVLWAAQTRDLLRFPVQSDGTLGPATVVPLPGAPTRALTGDPSGTNAAIPAGLAYTPDGQRLLVTFNGTNQLAVLNAATGAVQSQTAVGVAPRDVVVIGGKAYVANQGGRAPSPTDFVNPSYGSDVTADRRDGRASGGTVTELDLTGPTPTVVQDFPVGLQPTALLARGTDLLVANSNDDSVSVIDTPAHRVGQTINVNPLPVATQGASPNALAFSGDGHLLVSLGRDNAIAEYSYAGPYSPAGFDGLIPTDWYPGTVLYDKPLGKVLVGNIKGIGSLGAPYTVDKGPGTRPATGHGVYSDVGSLQLLTPPATPQDMQRSTQVVFSNNQWNGVAQRNAAPGRRVAPRAVPVHVGEPSTIKHVYLIVKENRTYDQVLGDDPRGNGDPSLAQFGAQVTPNAHALAARFPLIDNLYSDGTLSADGHNWLTQAFVNDYIEKSFGNFTRSYPASGADSLAYAKSGFLWDNAARHNLKATSWGEYANFFSGPGNTQAQGTWQQWYHDSQILEGKATGPLHAPVGYYQSHSDVPGLEKILQHDFPNFQTQIPDQYRADLFDRDYRRMEATGTLPSLGMLWVMNDHTAGIKPGFPTPRAEVADNDLAVGRIVDTISHSKDWASSAVFIVEDDSQNGVDHLDGHRNPVFVASPYTAPGKVVHTYYSELNVVRTIEQILGLPPMNQLDLAAQPMTDVFTDHPVTTAFTAVPNQIALDEYPGSAPARTAAAHAAAGIAVPAQPGTPAATAEAAWLAWANQQDLRAEDRVPMGQFNREIWYSSNGFTKPYPGDTAVLLPNQVPQSTPGTDGHPRTSPWNNAG